MVYCNGCGTIVAVGFYCVECRPSNFTTSAPPTDLIPSTANSENRVYNNSNWVAQFNQVPAICASNAVSTMHMEQNGTVIDITFASERRQCPCCLAWFLDEAGYNWHRKGYKFGCSEHGYCFPSKEVHYHGMKYEHDRCFVWGCTSQYRNETGWTPEQIKEHVKKAHNYSGKTAARTLHEASEAISLVSNSSFSKVSIKTCRAASSCGAMLAANTKAADSSGLKKRKEEEVAANSA